MVMEELLDKIFEKVGLGGLLMVAVVVIAMPSVAIARATSLFLSLFLWGSLLVIFFTGLYLFKRPIHYIEVKHDQFLENQRLVSRYIKRSVCFAVLSTLFFPPILGIFALVYAIKARKITDMFGNFFIIISVIAMLLGSLIGMLLGSIYQF